LGSFININCFLQIDVHRSEVAGWREIYDDKPKRDKQGKIKGIEDKHECRGHPPGEGPPLQVINWSHKINVDLDAEDITGAHRLILLLARERA